MTKKEFKRFYGFFAGFFSLIFLIIYGIYRLITRKSRKLERLTINELLTKFTPFEFEEYIADVFRTLGCTAKTTPKTNDCGYDVVYRNSQN